MSGRRRSGFTIAELMVAVVLGLITLYAIYQVVHFLVVSEKGTDRDATRAIVEAQLMESLLRDVRSAVSITSPGAGVYTIQRYEKSAGAFAKKDVTWKVDGLRVTRESAGESRQEFNFTGLTDPATRAYTFRLDRLANPEAKFAY